MVLLLSCGVVASPERSSSSIPLLNLNSLTGTTAGRADALLFVEFRGRVAENLPSTHTPAVADRSNTQTRAAINAIRSGNRFPPSRETTKCESPDQLERV